jgi:hypothetical protein
MGDSHDSRRKLLLQQSEIEVQAIEALERARMLAPGARRHELLKEAGKLRMQAAAQRLSGVGSDINAKGVGVASNGPRKKT